MAGLPARSACVSEGPPLFWSGPRRGLVAFRSPGPPNAHEASLLRLCPREVIADPLQLPPAGLFATMLFLSVRGSSSLRKPPPRAVQPVPLQVTLFAVTVLLVMVAVASLRRPPPLPRQFPFPLVLLQV